MFIPLGQKMGFGHVNPTTLLPPNQRKNVCCFMGSLRANRQEMLDVFTNANIPCLISKDKQWGDPSQLATVEYRRNLLDSTFALAPWGNNPESMRLYEALEAGAIPISQNYSTIDADKDFIHHGLPGWPCPVVNNWAEAPALVEAYLSNETALLNLQADMVSWWTSFKGTLQQDVKLKIDRAFLDHK